MATIGLVSDTHLSRFATRLPSALVEGLRGVDLILHLGDLVAPEVVPLFEALAPFDMVAGNNDGPEIHEKYGRKKILTIEGMRLGMLHGDGARGKTIDRALKAFSDVDAILFGHSHIPYCERHDGIWLVNPGSPTDKRFQPRYSYGILTIEDGKVTPHLFYFDRRD